MNRDKVNYKKRLVRRINKFEQATENLALEQECGIDDNKIAADYYQITRDKLIDFIMAERPF